MSSLHKLAADYLFTGKELLPGNHVLVCKDDGEVVEILEESDAGESVQRLRGVLSPGFVNCHCHLELSHMRGLIPEKTGLIDFVFSVVTQRHFTEDKILEAIEAAENEMLQNGIVAVGDICNSLFTRAQKEKGNLAYYNFVEASGWLPEIAEKRFAGSKDIYDTFATRWPVSIVPHAPYSVSQPLWERIKPFYHNRVVSVHNQETVFEDELFIQNTGDFRRMYEMMKLDTSFFKPSGKSSLQTYFDDLLPASSVILVHNTFTQLKDIEYVRNTGRDRSIAYCLCVNANQYIEQALPPVEMLVNNNCNVVLGTDSLASNRSLSILDEIKTICRSFTTFSIEEVLTWATSNGAKALQMEDRLGTFEPGKRPGVVIIENLDPVQRESLPISKAKRVL